MERYYETVCILKPEIGDEGIKNVVNRIRAVIEKNGGRDVEVESWGRKRLAYPIQKRREGYYVLFTYTAPPEVNPGLQHLLRYHEDVMRYQTVKLKKRVDLEKEKEAEED